MGKYTDQEIQVQKLRDEMTKLTLVLKQNEFQITHTRLNQLGEINQKRTARLSQASMNNLCGDDDASQSVQSVHRLSEDVTN